MRTEYTPDPLARSHWSFDPEADRRQQNHNKRVARRLKMAFADALAFALLKVEQQGGEVSREDKEFISPRFRRTKTVVRVEVSITEEDLF